MRLNWCVEEMILAADVADDLEWRGVNAKTRQVVELSELLQSAKYYPTEDRDDDFRSANSVGMKINNLRASHPSHVGKGLRVAKNETVVVELFVEHPSKMKQLASDLRREIYRSGGRRGDAATTLRELGIRA